MKTTRMLDLSRRVRDIFRIEALEQRMLLSADPLFGPISAVLAPSPDDGLHLNAAYAAAQSLGSKVSISVPRTAYLMLSPSVEPAPANFVVDAVDMNADVLQVDGLAALSAPTSGLNTIGASLVRIGGNSLSAAIGAVIPISSSVTDPDNIVINGSVQVDSTTEANIFLTAGSDGTGNLTLGGALGDGLNGNGDVTDDQLTLRAPGNVVINGIVGNIDPLASLTIEGVEVAPGVFNSPDNVSFTGEVVVDGDLTISASGTVTFSGALTLNNGGKLVILGADRVVFSSGVTLNGGGDMLVEGDEITFGGGEETVIGSGVLTLRPTNAHFDIEVGSPPSSVTLDTLNIDDAELKAFVDGFSRIVIGHEVGGHASATGSVRIGAVNFEGQVTLRDALEVYGNNITVEDYNNAGYTLAVDGTIKLDAMNNIVVRNTMEARNLGAGGLRDITLVSALGSISQSDAAGDLVLSEPLRAANLGVQAASGVSLGFVETDRLSVLNTGENGNIVVTETASGAGLSVLSASQSHVGALGNITLGTTAGTLTVASAGTGIANAGSGDVRLNAAGTASQILVNDTLTSTTGAVILNAPGAITITDDGTNDGRITTSAGAVTITSSAAEVGLAGNLVAAGGGIEVNALTDITMASAALASSVSGTNTGAITFNAGGSIALSQLFADGTITLSAATGAIVDALVGDGLNIDGDSGELRLSAATGIGTGAQALITRVARLQAINSTSGGVYIDEATELSLAVVGAGSYALDLAGSDGNASIMTRDGALSVIDPVRSIAATGTAGQIGNIRLASGELAEGTAADLSIMDDIVSTSGSITVIAADDLRLDDGTALINQPEVQTLATGQSIDWLAGGAIVMNFDANVQTNNGNIALQSTSGSSTIAVLNAGAGGVSIRAGGAIVDAQAADEGTAIVNVSASELRLDAATGVGSSGNRFDTDVGTLALHVGAGNAFLGQANALTIGTVAPVVVNRVLTNGATSAVQDALALSGLVFDGAGNFTLSSGSLALDLATSVQGNILLAVEGTLEINQVLDANGGSISLVSSGLLSLGASAVVRTSAAGTIDIASSAGAVSMADGALVQTGGANIRIAGAGAVTLAQLDARTAAERAGGTLADQANWGALSIVSGGDIVDAAESVSAVDIYASELRLQGTASTSSIGSAAAPLQTEVSSLSAQAGTGGLFVLDSSATAVGQGNAISVNRVKADGSVAGSTLTDAAQGELVSAGDLVLTTLDGAITTLGVGGSISANGNLALIAGGVNGDIVLGATVLAQGNMLVSSGGDIVLGAALTSQGGHMSLSAGRDIVQNADVGTLSAGKTIDYLAQRHITMAAGTSTGSTSDAASHILYRVASGDIRIGIINAGLGNVGLSAGAGSILDQDADGDSTLNIQASGLAMTAAAIGLGANRLETAVDTLAANAGVGGIYLSESDALTVDTVAIAVQRVDAQGAVTGLDTSVSDLSSGAGGNIVLVTTDGTITLNDGAGAGGVALAGGASVLLQAGGAGSVAFNANASTSVGQITVKAGARIDLAGAVTLATGAGDLSLLASGGAITMAGDSALTASGALRLEASAGLVLGGLSAGSVSLLSGAAGISAAEGSTLNISAADLRMVSGQGIGSGTRAINTAVARVSALASGAGQTGVYLSEADAITVDAVSVVTRETNASGAGGEVTDAALSDLVAQGTGSVVLLTTNGAITVNDGDGDGHGVNAGGVGNLLLQAGGAGSDISVNTDLLSGTGHVTVHAGGALSLAAGADVRTSGAGNISLQAGVGALSQNDNSLLITTSGSIRLAGALDVSVGGINTTSGNVAITSSAGSILDGGDTYVDVVAQSGALRLSAANGIGTLGGAANALETTVQTLSARAGAGGINIVENNSLVVDSTTVAVITTGADGLVGATITETQQSDLRTSNGGAIVVVAGGNLALQDGASADGAVSAHGAGNVRLQALNGFLSVGGDILSASGHVSVLANVASGQITFASGADVRTGGSGTIDIASDNAGVTQAGDSLLASGSGAIRVAAGTSIVLGQISTSANVSLISTVGSINDAHSQLAGANDSDLNISAGGLRMNAGNGVGQQINAIETMVTTVSARAGLAGIFLLESDGVTVGDVSVTVNRVKIDGDVTGSTVTDATQSDLITLAGDSGIALVSTSGNITLAPGTAPAGGSINVNGAGPVLVQTLAADGDIAGNAGIASSSGAITLRAGGTAVFGVGFTLQSSAPTDILAQHLQFNGGPDSLNGSGVLTLKAPISGADIVIGGVSGAGGLSLTQDAIDAIGTGFSKLVIGQAGLGNVTIMAGTGLQTANLPLEVLGRTITVAGGGASVQFFGDVLLHAQGDVVIDNTLSTAQSGAFNVLSDSGNVTMAGGSGVNTLGGDITVSAPGATSITLATLDARAAGGASAGVVVVDGGSANITDANQDSLADIFAKAVTINGFGPTGTGAQGAMDVLEVQTDIVYFNPPSGLVVRDSGTDGRNIFSLMSGTSSFQQLVVMGQTARVTSDPAGLLGGGPTALQNAGVPIDVAAMGRNLAWALNTNPAPASAVIAASAVKTYLTVAAPTGFFAKLAAPPLAQATQTETDLDALLRDQSEGVADHLQQAYVMGTPGQQSLVSGLEGPGVEAFEYWVDALSI